MADSYCDSKILLEVPLESSCFPVEFSKTNLLEYQFRTDIMVNPVDKEFIFKLYRRKYSHLLGDCYYQDGLIYSKNSIMNHGSGNVFFGKMNRKITIRIVFNGRHDSFESTKMDLQKYVNYRMSKGRKLAGNMIILDSIHNIEGIKVCNRIHFLVIDAGRKFISISIKPTALDDYDEMIMYRFLPRKVKEWLFKGRTTNHAKVKSYYPELSNCLSDFGIVINQLPMTIGKCLEVPELLPKDQTEALYKLPVEEINCAIVSDQSNDSEKINKLKNYLEEHFRKIGIKIANERFYIPNPIVDGSEEEIRAIFEDLKDNGVTYAFILTKKENPLPERNIDNSLLDIIKLQGSVYQIPNQILWLKESDLCREMIASSAAKMCFKQGGQINAIHPSFWNQYPFVANTTMFFGINIYSTKIRNVNIFHHSIVGTTGPDYCSPNLIFDAKLSQRQDPRLIESMLENLLEKVQNQAKPKNLIIFCNNYFERIHLKTDVKMTFIRVDLTSPYQFSRFGSELEVPHGTCADIDFISSKKFIIFIKTSFEYLLEGTKQTEFEVLWDDTEMSADRIKNLCFALCHIYSESFQANLSPTILQTAFKYSLRVKRKFQQLALANEDDSLDTLIGTFHQNINFY